MKIFFDPTVAIYSKQHLPYLICSAILSILLFFLPILLLYLYPTHVYTATEVEAKNISDLNMLE